MSCFAVTWLGDVFPGQELLGVVQLLEKKRRGADGSTQPSDLPRRISMIHAHSHRDGDCPRSMDAGKCDQMLKPSVSFMCLGQLCFQLCHDGHDIGCHIAPHIAAMLSPEADLK